MKISRLLVALAILCSNSPLAQAQEFLPQQGPQDTAFRNSLQQIMSDGDVQNLRGGSAGRKLGFYLMDMKREFNSGYQNESSALQAEWALAEHTYIKLLNGGDYVSCPLQAPSGTVGALVNGPATRDITKLKWNPPYDKLSDFADKWWREHDRNYHTLSIIAQWGFRKDAILDGANLWTQMERKNLPDGKTTTHDMYTDSLLAGLWEEKK